MSEPELIAPADLGDVFSLFHDGTIICHDLAGTDLHLLVRIGYLAERVNPLYRCFHVDLKGVTDVSFTTWPKADGEAASTLRCLAQIFEPALQILSAEPEAGLIKVICNQPSAASTHCGGELYLTASGAVVTDEAGKAYSIDALRQLSQTYWDEWGRRSK